MDISEGWKGAGRKERRILNRILVRGETPKAIIYFAKKCSILGDYWYWFMLSTLWVNYSEWSDLNLWKKLFSSKRGEREGSIMKPDEIECFHGLPSTIVAYRAHRKHESDWISYTLEPQSAVRFAIKKGISGIKQYSIKNEDCLALFLRRGEFELIVLDKNKVEFVREINLKL